MFEGIQSFDTQLDEMEEVKESEESIKLKHRPFHQDDLFKIWRHFEISTVNISATCAVIQVFVKTTKEMVQ